MLTFIVTVKSAQVTSNWTLFSKLVERTLKSICNQNDENYRVIVSCHELPDMAYKNDKIEYIQVPFDPPKLVSNDAVLNNRLKNTDKAQKILLAYEKAKSYDSDYIMVVDADDCISNAIAAFVNKQKNNPPGWYISKGYFYKEGTKYLILNTKTFNNICGTCLIVRTDLFPQLMTNDPFFHYNHKLRALPNGIPLEALPFKGALYSIANGENILMTSQQAKERAKKPKYSNRNFLINLYYKFYKYSIRPITGNFKRKFNFYNV